MIRPPVASIVLTFVVFLTAACAPVPAGSSQEPTSQAGSENRVLTLSVAQEPTALFSRLNTAGPTAAIFRLFGAGLTVVDDRGTVLSELAMQPPQLNTDTWRLLPDGKMETVYKLRPGLTWHDGEPLEAEDFVFAYQVQTHPAGLIRPSDQQRVMESVVAADPSTLVIRWRTVFPKADDLGISAFSPLPRHIVGEAFAKVEQGASSLEAFLNLPYWMGEYIGTGPYRLVGWVPGTYFEGAAFTNFALGKPKIDRVVIRVMDDAAVFTEVLAGTMQVAELLFEQYGLLQRDWVSAGKGTVTLTQSVIQPVYVQLRPEFVGHPALLDVRARRALAHSLDRQAINDGAFDGRGAMTETMAPPTAPFFPEVDRAIMKFPYDPRRSEQLMSEAGYPKGGDGFFADAAGVRVGFEHLRLLASDKERIQQIMIDTWRRAGFEVVPTISPLRGTLEQTVKSPGLWDDTASDVTFYGPNIATAANRWSGANKTGFSSAEYDRLFDAYSSTIDETERTRQFVQAQRIISEQVPAIYHYIRLNSWVVAAGLSGPKAEVKNIGTFTSGTQRYFNIHEWRWQ